MKTLKYAQGDIMKIVYALLLSMFLIIGCGTVDENPQKDVDLSMTLGTDDDDSTGTQIIEKESTHTIVEPDKNTEAVTPSEDLNAPANDPKVDEMINTQDKVNELEYYYSDYDNSLAVQDNNIEHIKMIGNKILIDFERIITEDGYDYNSIYINKDLKETYLICSNKQCNPKNTAKKAEYGKYELEHNPYDILTSLRNAQYVMEQRYDDKECLIFVETADDYQDKIYVWKFYGMPLFIERTSDDKIIRMNYEDMSINSLEDENVGLPDDVEYV